MSKKLNIDFICAEFKKEGYILLTEEYVNSKQKLEYICPKGHRHSIGWNDFKSGKRRCPYCSKKAKKTIEFIRLEFEKEDYVLSTEEYINNSQKLDYICPNGCRHSISWSSWKQGQRCPCFSNNNKLTIDFIYVEFKKEDYTLLTKRYVNNRQKLDYICPKGCKDSMSWNNWNHGHRCPKCSTQKAASKLRLSFPFIKKEFKKKGYTILTKKYINSRQKLDYVCSRGHKHSICWDEFKRSRGCLYCYLEDLSKKMMGKNNPSWKGGISKEPYCQDWTNDLKGFVKERDDFKCLNPYCSSKNPEDLTVHHIDYNKKSCGAKNLITVCRSCNGKANKDRNWHKAWYQAILNKRYSYIY